MSISRNTDAPGSRRAVRSYFMLLASFTCARRGYASAHGPLPIKWEAASRVRRSRRPRCAGITVIEMILTMTIVLVVVSIFSRMVIATSGLRTSNRENAIAAEAARVALERMRNQDFNDLFELYNDDPTDDPGGQGTGPGHRFLVEGLPPLATSKDGLAGEIFFPADVLPPFAEDEGLSGTPPPPLPDELQLREDLILPQLGMPRDLNGDSIIDEYDHADDYVLLPIRIRIEWKSTTGPREFEIFTMLGNFIL